jgi:cysteine desulfurase / selenocysteine lyase
MSINIDKIRSDFPILSREVYPGIPLIYFDNAATSQKPTQVIQSMDNFYQQSNANIHRGIHVLAEESTAMVENSRAQIADFINANSPKEIVFTRNATESINLIAQTWGRTNLVSGDLIILTEMEHHSNLVPWQILSKEKELQLEFIPVSENGQLDLIAYRKLLDLEPRLVSFTHMSNVLGTINPAKEIIELAHDVGALTVVDGAQSAPHFPVDVIELEADFMAFSAHKMCGPTGIGVLYGRKELLLEMPPFLGGGDMIKRVSLHSFSTNDIPYKFEAGTPAIAEVIGFGAAVQYLKQIGMDSVAEHERAITSYALQRLQEVPGVKIFGLNYERKGGVISFLFEDFHAHDIAQVLDRDGIAIRAGHHCAMPLHEKFGMSATARVSFYLYNTEDEIDHLVKSLYHVRELFGL